LIDLKATQMAIIKEDGIVRGKKDKIEIKKKELHCCPPPSPTTIKKINKNEIENKNKK
jgi:hypothetical protein